jgi:ribosomal protein S6
MKYELFYLVGSTKEAELENIQKEVSAIISENGGVFDEKGTIEKRKMSYEIKHETHGIYIAKRFEMESEKIDDVIRRLNLNSGVLRFVISRADELPPLKTKEERLEEAKKKTLSRPQFQEERKLKEAKKPEKPEKTEEKKETQEDIDKKLEEILNI